MTGVTVRTLHHYDAVGLLVPSERSAAGYRLYDERDLLRLQQILIGRELGLSLDRIRASLDDPEFDRRRALLEQREALRERARQAERMIRSVDRALALLDRAEQAVPSGTAAEEEDMAHEELFEGFDPSAYEDEANARWGHTEAWRESKRKAKSYTKEDWTRMRAEQDRIYQDAAELLRTGAAPDSEEARAVAERHRQSITRWFYPCGLQLHRGLADLWEADERFARSIDQWAEGLTPFLAAAVRTNADAQKAGA